MLRWGGCSALPRPQPSAGTFCGAVAGEGLSTSVGKLRQGGTATAAVGPCAVWPGQAMAPLGVHGVSPAIAHRVPAQHAAGSLPLAFPRCTSHPAAGPPPPPAAPAPKEEAGGDLGHSEPPGWAALVPRSPRGPPLSGRSTWALGSPAYARPVLLVSAQFLSRCSGNGGEGRRWRSPPGAALPTWGQGQSGVGGAELLPPLPGPMPRASSASRFFLAPHPSAQKTHPAFRAPGCAWGN